ncbi:cation transporter [Chitinimonas sp. BJB300]|uniref:cation transporter n=1 Tax=Chitinimonas sp. BJB300 TaxID=1559339 RepID=UPI000C0F9D27|nr:cation diffusion facilitator family transporter [Chitinimonas sp. BJB300]PHV10004.1 cation transporter [Chitinimonas sp. BJB300]TSJ83842.1 cation transporter [Chitinimonas sp. BJB300]
MGANCCHHEPETNLTPTRQGRYRKVLWVALVVNAVMFGVEIFNGVKADSVSLLADSLDFLGDAANYAISLWVLGMAVSSRAKASLLKAVSMGVFGLWIIGSALWHWASGTTPSAVTMGWVGTLALLANLGVAVLLYAYREGDSNMRSVWLCTRNDALGNLAVLLAALGVFGTGQAWPDLMVALVMASLALSAAWQVMIQANRELATV